MKNKISKIILCTFLVLTLLGNTCFAVTNADQKPDQLIKYENWLNTKLTSSAGDEKVATQNFINQFNALSKINQEKFVEYMTNEASLKTIVKEITTSNTNKTLLNGDFLVKVNQSVNEKLSPLSREKSNLLTGTYAVSSSVSTRASYTRTGYLLGVAMLEMMFYVDYSYVPASYISSINGYNVLTLRCFVPLTITYSNTQGKILSNKAYCTSDFTFCALVDWAPLTVASGEGGVWGDVFGSSAGWVTQY